MAKFETVYAPFQFSLVDLAHGKPVHEGQDGMLLVFRDKIAAYEQLDKLKQIEGPVISAFGCGPEGDQHVRLPACTGMLHLDVPANMIINDKQVCIMSDKLPVGPNDIKIFPSAIRQADFRVEGDIAHGPLTSMQLTNGDVPDYDDISRFARIRLEDLARITDKIAGDTAEHRTAADLEGEFVRDALQTVYNSAGFAHHRIRINDSMSPAQQAMLSGLEYFQPYIRAIDANMGIDAILRHAHTMEQEFKDAFPGHYQSEGDVRAAAAMTVAGIMHTHAEASTDFNERMVFMSLKVNAEHDAEMYRDVKPEADLAEDEPELPDNTEAR